MKRKTFLVLAPFLFSIMTLLCAFESTYGQGIEKLNIGYSGTGITQYVLEMPRRLGIYRKNGLDPLIVYVGSGSLLSQALIGGSFDIAFSQGSEAMLARLRGADQRIVASVANRFNHVYMTAPSITSIKQLKGKKIAVSRFGSGSHFMTNLVLREAGLDPERDVSVLQIGNSGSRLAAILTGSVDGTIMAADFIPQAKKEGLNVLVDLADTKIEYPFLTFNMMGPVVDRRFNIIKAFIKSISEGIYMLQTDSVAAKAAIKAALRTDDLETIEFAAMRSAKVLERRPFPTRAALQTVVEELSPKEPKAKSSKLEDFVDLRALREVEREGGLR
jgi:NitT/TauT family transport system substrate-binding protein